MDWRATTLIWISRLTGLGLLIYSVGPFSEFLATLVRYVQYPPGNMRAGGTRVPWGILEWLLYLVQQLPAVFLVVLGLNLLLGGRWLLRRMLRGLDGTCPACGHPWPDAGAVRCPECGFGVMATRPRREAERAGTREPSEKVS